jgi:hypothetical protein
VDHYRHAVESEDTSNPATLRAIEQWINLAVRLGEKGTDKGMIEAAIEKGRHLLGIAKTSERLNLMGSAHKKLAQCEPDGEKVKGHLRQSASYYREAASRPQHEGAVDPYPIINALVVEALLGKEDRGREASLSTCESLVQQRFNKTRSAWDAITIVDVALIRAFLRRSLPQERDGLVEKYRSVFTESAATQRQQDSALAQIKFMSDILKTLPQPNREIAASAIHSLDSIHTQLQPSAQIAKPLAGEAKQKAGVPRSPKTLAKQSARKSPAQKKRSHRPTRPEKGIA